MKFVKTAVVGAICLVTGWHMATLDMRVQIARLKDEHQEDRKEMQYQLLEQSSAMARKEEEQENLNREWQKKLNDDKLRMERLHRNEMGELKYHHGLEKTELANKHATNMRELEARLTVEFEETRRNLFNNSANAMTDLRQTLENAHSVNLAHAAEVHQALVEELGAKHHNELLEMIRVTHESLEEKIKAAREEGFAMGEQAMQHKIGPVITPEHVNKAIDSLKKEES